MFACTGVQQGLNGLGNGCWRCALSASPIAVGCRQSLRYLGLDAVKGIAHRTLQIQRAFAADEQLLAGQCEVNPHAEGPLRLRKTALFALLLQRVDINPAGKALGANPHKGGRPFRAPDRLALHRAAVRETGSGAETSCACNLRRVDFSLGSKRRGRLPKRSACAPLAQPSA